MPLRAVISFLLTGSSPDDTAPAAFDEGNDLPDLRRHLHVFLHVANSVADMEFGAVDHGIDALDRVDCFSGKTSSMQTDGIQTVVGQRSFGCPDIWWDVLRDPESTTHHGMGTYTTELVDRYCAANDDIILDIDMTTDLAGIGNDHIVTDPAVVRNMAVSQKQDIAADLCLPPVSCAAMHCAILTDCRVVTNDGFCFLIGVFQVLGDLTDDGALENPAVLADGRSGPNMRVSFESDTITDGSILLNDCIGTDNDIFTNVDVIITDDCGGVYACCHA